MPNPANYTYPGVYVNEVDSGVHTITGVATSITAFVGHCLKGPINEPVQISSYTDFERIFGGLWLGSYLGFSVRDFYLNGGSQAIIVRVFPEPSVTVPVSATENLVLVAAPNSTWRDKLNITVQMDQATQRPALIISPTATDDINHAETFTNLQTELATSKLVRVQGNLPTGTLSILTTEPIVLNCETARISLKCTLPTTTTPTASAAQNAKKANSLKSAFLKATQLAAAAFEADSSQTNGAAQQTYFLLLEVLNPGSWGNSIQVEIGHYDPNDTVSIAVAKQYNLTVTDLFSLKLIDSSTKETLEKFEYLSIEPNNNACIDKVLANNSQYIRVISELPPFIPDAISDETTPPILFSGGNDGTLDAQANATAIKGSQGDKTGIYALEKADLFNLLYIPGYITNSPFPDHRVGYSADVDSIDSGTSYGVLNAAAKYCISRNAFLIIDPPANWSSKDAARTKGIASLGIDAEYSSHAAVFFPRIKQANPLKNYQLEEFLPGGMVAGTFARIDAQRGVWKAPAGLEAQLNGLTMLSVSLTDNENGDLNPLGINCLRTMPLAGAVIWGSRTLAGDDRLNSAWKYIPVRRLALYLKMSLYRGTQWVVFEPNDESLWRQIVVTINSFMNNLFKQGAFQGKSAQEAYFVKCDSTTNTQQDIDNGIVNIVIGFAPVKPAEFVVITIQQIVEQN